MKKKNGVNIELSKRLTINLKWYPVINAQVLSINIILLRYKGKFRKK